ncbi:MAG: hypothetical protein ABGZ23_16385, partial [Fuerstiella sp.]
MRFDEQSGVRLYQTDVSFFRAPEQLSATAGAARRGIALRYGRVRIIMDRSAKNSGEECVVAVDEETPLLDF